MLRTLTAALIAYGPWGICLLSVIDSLGVPLPAAIDVLMVGIGASSVRSPGRAYLAALLAMLGSTAGNVGLFLAARQGRKWFAGGGTDPGKGQRFRRWFDRYGLLTVFIPAVTPVVPLPLKVFVVSAGALHTPLRKFLAVIVLARVIRYFGEAYLGIQLGEDAAGFLTRHGWALAAAALGLGLALFWLIRLSDRRPELPAR